MSPSTSEAIKKAYLLVELAQTYFKDGAPLTAAERLQSACDVLGELVDEFDPSYISEDGDAA